MIGIIGAMDEEVGAVLAHLEDKKEKLIFDVKLTEGKIGTKEVVVCQSGIGKVNATFSTTLLLSNYDVDFIINIGTAGGLNPDERPGDVVISTGVASHDFDLTAFGREIGQVPDLPRIFEANPKLVEHTKEILAREGVTYHIGLIVSGDQFLNDEAQVAKIKDNFIEPLAGEMEASAIAQICHKTKTPFIITRCLSDVFGIGDESNLQFDEYLKLASKISADICVGLVNYE